MICQFPFLFSWFEVSIRIAISAILNTAVTRNTARTMHKIVIDVYKRQPVLESGSIAVRLLQGQAYKNGVLLEPVSYTHLDVYKRQTVLMLSV